ncbi:MAG: pilus assembly protein [Alphaproteobacteria bacterium]|jgi:Flp pilus assembly protein TadG|nr:pilus assembly protein [Alphaproteobacteria bacterium]
MFNKLTSSIRLNKIFSCQKGASLVEFAIVFPILITIILSIFELGIMLTIKVNMQSCVMSGAFYGATGAYTTGSTRTASAQAVMTNGMSSILNPSNVTMTLQSYPTFAIANLGGPGTAGSGNAGQVGMYKMQYAYSPSSPLIAALFGGTKVLQATSYTKNEGTFPS